MVSERDEVIVGGIYEEHRLPRALKPKGDAIAAVLALAAPPYDPRDSWRSPSVASARATAPHPHCARNGWSVRDADPR